MGERYHRDRKVTRRKKGRDGEKLRQKENQMGRKAEKKTDGEMGK